VAIDFVLQIVISRVDFIEGPFHKGFDKPILVLEIIVKKLCEIIETTTHRFTPFQIVFGNPAPADRRERTGPNATLPNIRDL
jgi:hypothetical protein